MSKDIKKAIEDTLKKEDLLFAEVNYYYTDTVEAIYNAIKPIIINAYLDGDSNGCGCYDYSTTEDAENYIETIKDDTER